MKEFRLNNNVLMPSVGIGTFLLQPNDAYNSVLEALKMGYRLIDTANAYQNERACGKAIKDSKVNRNDIFVSTKLWPSEYKNINAVDETLERLDLDYIDLLFLHQPAGDWKSGYKMLEKGYKEGKIKAIGISNFEAEIEDLLSWCEIKPQVIQVECHPNFPQADLKKITNKYDIKLMAWYPLGGQGKVKENLDNEIIVNIANKYKKSPAQIILKWHNEMGHITIPGSKNPAHIKANIDLFDFDLNESDMKELEKLNIGVRQYISTPEALAGYAMWQPEYEKK